MKIKDVTRQKGDVVSLVNSAYNFKSVKIYKYKENMIIKSVTNDDKLQISASTPSGPSDELVMESIFQELSSKSIENFEVKYTSQAIYFFEKDIVLN